MNLMRHALAVVLWRLQCHAPAWLLGRLWGYHGGRHVDWEPVWCEECGWRGPRRWCWHTYGDDGSGEDVVAVDECPGCGMEV